MPVYTIVQQWRWEEAFDKYGFGDGDDPRHTSEVVAEIERPIKGQPEYVVTGIASGIHNEYITTIRIVNDDGGVGALVYDGPFEVFDDLDEYANVLRADLPADLVARLDAMFDDDYKGDSA